MSFNRVILIGNLGADPEVRFTSSGTQVARLRLATSEFFKRPNGEGEKRTEWHNLTAWGKRAQVAGDHLKKGRQICVEGRLRTRRWEDKEGKPRYTTEVVADRITFLGKKQDVRDDGEEYESIASENEEMPF